MERFEHLSMVTFLILGLALVRLMTSYGSLFARNVIANEYEGDSIYNKENTSSNFFISGSFDLQDPKMTFFEISDEEKFNAEDIIYIENEFNDLILEEGYKNLFNFPKFKVFLKSIISEKN